MTLLQSRLLMMQVAALLAVTAGIFTWYNKYFSEFYKLYPYLSLCVVFAVPLYIFIFSVGPQTWRRRREAHLRAVTLTSNPAEEHSVYYRLDPYVTADPDKFRRDDNAHRQVLTWVRQTAEQVLFLSGVSGAGKSSVLESYVVPVLKREGWQIEQVRNFDDPLPQLEMALARRRSDSVPLLILLDQFEEFIILEERSSVRRRAQFLSRVREIHQASDLGIIRMLFAFRRDYMGDVIGLRIAQFILGQTFMEVDAFRRDAARHFFENAPDVPSSALISRLLTGAEALDDVPARFRPVTLNMLGLALQDFDKEITVRPEQLVQGYMQRVISQPDIREIAPPIVGRMITEVNTAYPRSVGELAAETGVRNNDVAACLILLARKGLVRQLDAKQNLWTVSHDFVARQFALLLGRLPRRRWPAITMFGIALLFATLLLIIAFGVPLYIRYQAFADLRAIGVNVLENNHGGLTAKVSNDDQFERALPYLKVVGLEGLDLGFSSITKLPSLVGFNELKQLNLAVTPIIAIESFDGLPALEVLNLHLLWRIKTLPSFRNLQQLRSLDLSELELQDIPPLSTLINLQELNLQGTLGIPDLEGLSALKTLDLRDNKQLFLPDSIIKLPSLQKVLVHHEQVGENPLAEQLRAKGVKLCEDLEHCY